MSFQAKITSEAAWEDEIGTAAAPGCPGYLQVVEVFSGWAGPSKVLVAAFKKIYFEHSDAKLKFYTCSSSIGPCSKFASSCQSGFLFYKDGACVGEMTGIDLPAIQAKIKQHV